MLINTSNAKLMLSVDFVKIDFKAFFQHLLNKFKCNGSKPFILQSIRH